MVEIRGKYGIAKVFTDTLEPSVEGQIRTFCDQTYSAESTIRIMPDVHAGKGCTIGTTMTVKDKICPNIVGVDIGCGMYTVKLSEKNADLKLIDEACRFIPSGLNIWEGRIEKFDLTRLKCYRSLKNTKRLEKSLGTLGGGNHFIEVDKSADGTLYLVIHSGSRNLGKQVAEYYQELAVNLNKGIEEYFAARDEIIRRYKEEGKKCEIQDALKQLNWAKHKETTVSEDICWLYGTYLDDYLHDVEICQQFAKRSREKMAEIILQRCALTAVDAFHTIHNYIDTDEMILRKGAIAAHKGGKVLIPVNMRDGSVIAVGKGNPEWNYSAPHGAGRIISRKKGERNAEYRGVQGVDERHIYHGGQRIDN